MLPKHPQALSNGKFPAVIRPSRKKPPVPAYQLEVELLGMARRVWRRFVVPGDASLGWLHAVIQVGMGWTNSHLHMFRLGGAVYSDASFDDDPAVLDENKIRLITIAPRENDTFTYEYDFGDSWEHRITVETLLPSAAIKSRSAQCLDGARTCPPEDCGGIGGYAELLKTIRNPKREDYESMMEWLGGNFDPDAFDVKTTQSCLDMLKWPRTTESQLRKILMRRDGY
jgi:hypothetical protein